MEVVGDQWPPARIGRSRGPFLDLMRLADREIAGQLGVESGIMLGVAAGDAIVAGGSLRWGHPQLGRLAIGPRLDSE